MAHQMPGGQKMTQDRSETLILANARSAIREVIEERQSTCQAVPPALLLAERCLAAVVAGLPEERWRRGGHSVNGAGP